MSESPQQPPGEGAFGAPPGASPWPQPGRARPGPASRRRGTATRRRRDPYPAAYPPQPSTHAATRRSTRRTTRRRTRGTYRRQTSPFPVSTFVLLVVSVISLIATGIIGIPSAVVSVVAWRQNATDPAACRQADDDRLDRLRRQLRRRAAAAHLVLRLGAAATSDATTSGTHRREPLA